MNIMYKSNLLSQWGTQAYTIVLPEARHEISIDTSDCGWISLGEYESTSGVGVRGRVMMDKNV